MCACTETDVRESAKYCILASGEGHDSRGETLQPICAARPVSSSSERSVPTNQNYLYKEIKRRLTQRNVRYLSVQNILFSHLLSKNIKITIHKTLILSVLLYGCKTWSLTLTEEHRPRVFQNMVLKRIFWPKRDEAGEYSVMRTIITFTPHHVLLEW
jgi:hypothetical protein